jgi:hypothetical protein
MSIFASHTTQTIPVPFDAPHTVTIQKLSGRGLEAAQLAHLTGVVTGRGRNWATTFVRRAAAGLATNADAEKVLHDPLSGYDRVSLVQGGLTAWSYEQDGEKKPITPAAIEDLDEDALEWLATAVLKLTKPALFQTADEQETARKNG